MFLCWFQKCPRNPAEGTSLNVAIMVFKLHNLMGGTQIPQKTRVSKKKIKIEYFNIGIMEIDTVIIVVTAHKEKNHCAVKISISQYSINMSSS